jgi:serine/threonine protein kinase/formylglycine-generating enzyme required for sulfatase activity/Flp pilus assembly protein TadD
MGVVFEAEQLSLGRHVALKVLTAHRHLKPLERERFQQEARAAARLHHTNIVPVFGLGEQDGLHYYVMQFIPGLSLDKVLGDIKRLSLMEGDDDAVQTLALDDSAEIVRNMLSGTISVSHVGLDEASASKTRSPLGSPGRVGAPDSVPSTPLPCGEALPGILRSDDKYFRSVTLVGIQVAEALGYAHAQGTLHRDIKPSNLILDTQGRIWITDFGLAKVAKEQELTREGDIVGTLRYMAPERFAGVSDPGCDVYSLGLTLYEMVSLQPPFAAVDRAELIKQITDAKLAPLRQIRPNVPHDLETIILKAIDPEPSRRYDGAFKLAEDLRNFLEDRPINARRTVPLERFSRWCRRNPLVASLTMLVAVLMATVTVGSIYSVQSLRVERDARTQELAEKLLTTPAANFPHILAALESGRGEAWHDWILPRLNTIVSAEAVNAALKIRAAVILALLGEPKRDFLVEALRSAPESEYGNIVLALKKDREAALGSLLRFAAAQHDPSMKVRLACALLGLGDHEAAREILSFSQDTSLRTAFIHSFSSFNLDLSQVPDLLRSCEDPALGSGLCAAVGMVDPGVLPVTVRDRLEAAFLELYRNAPWGSTHSAAGWALRRWQVGLPLLEPVRFASPDRKWFVNSTGMTLVEVPPGVAALGDASTPHSAPRFVYLTRSFYMLDREVSAGLFAEFMADSGYPSDLKPVDWPGPSRAVSPTADCPVQNVSLGDAILFANWLSRKEGRETCYFRLGKDRWRCDFRANGYRLPTEAEWERGCRAGTTTAFFIGDEVERISAYAHMGLQGARPGASFLPNGLGLFDMMGNVWERCWDGYQPSRSGAPRGRMLEIDPVGIAYHLAPGMKTVVRGGGVGSDVFDFKSGRRLDLVADQRQSNTGFRLVCCDEQPDDQVVLAGLKREIGTRVDNLKSSWRALRRWYCQRGLWEDGEVALAKALEDNPRDTGLLTEYAIMLTAQCLWDRAAAAYRKIAEIEGRGGPEIFEGSWWISGPYHGGLQVPFPPEQYQSPCETARDEVFWQAALPEEGNLIRFDTYFDLDSICAYALTHLYSTRDRYATLLVGSDDTVRVWINGDLVHEYGRARLATPDSDEIPVHLKAGWNKILAKVFNSTVAHELYLRFSDDPIACARAYGRNAKWKEAEAVLAEQVNGNGKADAKLLIEHARALAGCLRWDDAAAAVRRALDAGGGNKSGDLFQSGWWVVGPYPHDLKAPCPPETDPDPSRPVGGGEAGKILEWRGTTGQAGVLDLGDLFGHAKGVSVFALTYVFSPGDQEATLLIGAEDRARVWLSSQLVHNYPEFPLPKRSTPLQERVNVRLASGWNRILIKVGDDTGELKLNFRVSTDPLEHARALKRTGELANRCLEAIQESNTRPNDPAVWLRLGHIFAAMGEWDKASSTFGEAVRCGAPNHVRRYVALALLASGHVKEAGATCDELLLKLTASESNARDLARAVLSCVISPEVGDIQRLLHLAESAARRDERDPLCLTVLGAACYRAGQYAGAVTHLRRAVELGGDAEGSPYGLFFLAMALYQVENNQEGEASTWLEKAVRWTEGRLGGDENEEAGTEKGLRWDERQSLHLLRQEAGALFGRAKAAKKDAP